MRTKANLKTRKSQSPQSESDKAPLRKSQIPVLTYANDPDPRIRQEFERRKREENQ